MSRSLTMQAFEAYVAKRVEMGDPPKVTQWSLLSEPVRAAWEAALEVANETVKQIRSSFELVQEADKKNILELSNRIANLAGCLCGADETSSEDAPESPETTPKHEVDARHKAATDVIAEARASRERLPADRPSVTRVFRIAGRTKAYFHAGMYADGRPGEVFATVDQAGSTVRGLMDAVGVLISLALQHGVPMKTIVDKLKGTKFDPSGFTGAGDVPSCTSPLDLLARWLESKFVRREEP